MLYRSLAASVAGDGVSNAYQHPRQRWMTRRSVRALAAAMLGLACLSTSNNARAELDNCNDPLPRPGPARPWEAGIDVSPYCEANTRHRNLFAAIPIVGWSGTGPDMAMALYHNAATVGYPGTWTNNVGFSLGAGWTVAYSDQLILTGLPNAITVVSDDGTEDVFTWNATTSIWDPPAGIHDELELVDAPNGIWRLTHKNQAFHEFVHYSGTIAHLTRIVDATGNALTINYEFLPLQSIPKRIISVTAAGRVLNFTYCDDPGAPPDHQDCADVGLGRLWKIEDPGGGEDCVQDQTCMPDRFWELNYVAGKLDKFFLPQVPGEDRLYISFLYHADGRLSHLYGRDDRYHTFAYHADGGLLSVTEEDDLQVATDGRSQAFNTFCNDFGYVYNTQYVDRRGNEWRYYYHAGSLYPDGNLTETRKPLYTLNPSTDLLWDEDRNLVQYVDERGAGFNAQYDTRGNLLEIQDGLDHLQEWEYDSNNNSTAYIDALGNRLEFAYELSPTYPTLLTKITEPPAAANGPTAITTLEYFLSGAGLGQVKKVTDPMGVVTKFDYDVWGQPSYYAEGEVSAVDKVCRNYRMDAGGRSVYSDRVCPGGGVAGDGVDYGGGRSYDPLDQSRGSNCVEIQGTASPTACPQVCAAANFAPYPCPGPSPAEAYATLTGATYNERGQLTSLPILVNGWNPPSNNSQGRDTAVTYDPLGRVLSHTVDSAEEAASDRVFIYTYAYQVPDPGNDVFTITRLGTDAVETVITYDVIGRVKSYRKGPSTDPIVQSIYEYYDNDLIKTVIYGNPLAPSARTEYEYDAGNRLLYIDHRSGDGLTSLRKLSYTYDNRNLPLTISETGSGVTSSVTTFSYDNRGRLKTEGRTGGSPYASRIYLYDEGGNRVYKGPGLQPTHYYYDLINPTCYGSKNNRLMTSVRGDTQTWYYYSKDGNPVYIVSGPKTDGGSTSMMSGSPEVGGAPDYMVGSIDPYDPNIAAQMADLGLTIEDLAISDASVAESEGGGGEALLLGGCPIGSSEYTATRLIYARNGETVAFALGEKYCWDGESSTVSNTQVTWAREFRYDSGRARYLNRKLIPSGIHGPSMTFSEDPAGTVWTDYDGDDPYMDFAFNPSFQSLRGFEPGLAKTEPWASSGSTNTNYYHSDHLGTTRLMTDSAGAVVANYVFTAFGEPVAGAPNGQGNRYGYAGADGYQAHDEMPFLHVGARYYDPSSGRFLQRDPIGILGGLNPYAYAESSPTVLVDPFGLSSGASDMGRFWAYLARNRLKDAEALLESIAQLEGRTEAVRRAQQALKAAQAGAKWFNQMLKRMKPKDLRDMLDRLRKTLQEHVEKYKNHPDSKEIAELEWKVRVLEDMLRCGG